MVVVRVFKGGALIIKGVHRTTFGATAVPLLAKHKPVELVRVCRRARATDDALDVQGEDFDRVC